MFSLLKKNPEKRLNKEYEKLLGRALEYQRKGDIKNYSLLSKQADDILKKIDRLKSHG